jgi:hypothetical protein
VNASSGSWQVAASADDCQVYESGTGHPPWDTLDTGWSMGYTLGKQGGTYYGTGHRFLNVGIDVGATIDSAVLSLRAFSTASATTVALRLACEDVDDAATFSNVANYNGRARTSYVSWTVGSWTADTWYSSSSIVSCLQTVINRAGWVSGNDIVVFCEDDGTSTQSRSANNYDFSSSSAAKLIVTWHTGETDPPQYQVSTIGRNCSIAGFPTLLSCNWTDASGISGFILSHNSSGTIQNETWTSTSGSTWTNKTITTNSTAGNVQSWKIYANDSAPQNNWNGTMPWQNYTLTADPPDYYSLGFIGGQGGKDCTFTVNWTDPTNNLDTCLLNHNNSGSWLDTNITVWSKPNNKSSWANYTLTLNATSNVVVQFRYWCNSTHANTDWNVTTTMSIQVGYLYPNMYNCHDEEPTHGQPEGNMWDVGSLLTSNLTSQELRFCTNWIGFVFDVNNNSLTISNIYYHLWWAGSGNLGWNYPFIYSSAQNETTGPTNRKTLLGYNLAGQKHTITQFTAAGMYNFSFKLVGTNPYAISSSNMTSFVIFNLPSDATLQSQDWDTDGLTDYDELFTYYTNPAKTDTDDDGSNDKAEVDYGSDPLDDQSFPAQSLSFSFSDTSKSTASLTQNKELAFSKSDTAKATSTIVINKAKLFTFIDTARPTLTLTTLKELAFTLSSVAQTIVQFFIGKELRFPFSDTAKTTAATSFLKALAFQFTVSAQPSAASWFSKELAFQFSVTPKATTSLSPLKELAFKFSDSVQALTSSSFLKGLGFAFSETVKSIGTSSIQKELSFRFTETGKASVTLSPLKELLFRFSASAQSTISLAFQKELGFTFLDIPKSSTSMTPLKELQFRFTDIGKALEQLTYSTEIYGAHTYEFFLSVTTKAIDSITMNKAKQFIFTETPKASASLSPLKELQFFLSESAKSIASLLPLKALVFRFIQTATSSASLLANKELQFYFQQTASSTANLSPLKEVAFILSDSAQALASMVYNKALGFNFLETIASTSTLASWKELQFAFTDTGKASSNLISLKELLFQFSDSAQTSISLLFQKAMQFNFLETASSILTSQSQKELAFRFIDIGKASTSLSPLKALLYQFTETAEPTINLIIQKALGFSFSDIARSSSSMTPLKALLFKFTDTGKMITQLSYTIQQAGAKALTFFFTETAHMLDSLVMNRAAQFTFTDTAKTSTSLFPLKALLYSFLETAYPTSALTPNKELGFFFQETASQSSNLQLMKELLFSFSDIAKATSNVNRFRSVIFYFVETATGSASSTFQKELCFRFLDIAMPKTSLTTILEGVTVTIPGAFTRFIMLFLTSTVTERIGNVPIRISNAVTNETVQVIYTDINGLASAELKGGEYDYYAEYENETLTGYFKLEGQGTINLIFHPKPWYLKIKWLNMAIGGMVIVGAVYALNRTRKWATAERKHKHRRPRTPDKNHPTPPRPHTIKRPKRFNKHLKPHVIEGPRKSETFD